MFKLFVIKTISQHHCYHCGDNCKETIVVDEKYFCCEGCKQVYLLLNENELCNFYAIDSNPGIKAKGKFVSNKYQFLDDENIIKKLIQFNDAHQTNVTFHLPQIHCSSCVYLLENLHRINNGIIKSQTNFHKKEIFIAFNAQQISLRKVVELLAFIGYEPTITINESENKLQNNFNKKRIYKIGIAGFCFANIMMLSFPEYFSSGNIDQQELKQIFSWLIFGLSIPVLLYSASDFFISAYNGLKQKFLNIDAPIALAILVTYARSYYEITTSRGAGFLDSGTGIVFFMLVGRWFQTKTYDSLSFDRNYKSYFPLGVSIIENDKEKNIPVTQLKKGNRIIIRNEEIIPADAILLSDWADIDYSFVSGENIPVNKKSGDLIFAGGKLMGKAIELEIVKEVSQSYITQLWNNDIFLHKKNKQQSFIHPWSKYFTIVLLSIAVITTCYWYLMDVSKLWTALTAVLIVACPCSLLLSATFTYGNVLRYLGKNKFYLKNSNVIESLSNIDTIVFDKTGTLTNTSNTWYEGSKLNEVELTYIKLLVSQSTHPLSKKIAHQIQQDIPSSITINNFKEYSGLGVEGTINNCSIKIGSIDFLNKKIKKSNSLHTNVYIEIDGLLKGKFVFNVNYREGIQQLIKVLNTSKYDLHVLSGDNNAELSNLVALFNTNANINFKQSPQDKLNYIKELQLKNKKVLMLGDGLNDAGALMQSDVGIAISDHSSRFSPACDALLDGNHLQQLNQFLQYSKASKKIITASFILSILYNIVGIGFAAQSLLSPMIAAILMPLSSISIVIFVGLLTKITAAKILQKRLI
jgi:P-type Cu+ transporter